jgi:hypothetical protein
MHASRLGGVIAILATTIGFAVVAGRAQAQIPGETGGDYSAGHHPLPAPWATSPLTPATASWVPAR